MAYLGRIKTGWDKSSPLTKGLVLIVSVTIVLITSFLAINIARIYDTNRDYSIGTLRGIPIEEVINNVKSSGSIRYERFYVADQGYDYPEPPIDWNWQMDENRTHNFYLHSWDNINRELIQFDEDKDVDVLEDIVDNAIDWVENNKVEFENNQDENFAWYDMAVGVRLYRMAYILDQSVKLDSISQNEAEVLWESILDHLEYLKNDNNIIFHNNHGVFQAVGQKAAARRLLGVDEKQFSRISEEGSNRLFRMVKTQFTSEGVHKEHSPSYQDRMYQVFLKINEEGLLSNGDMSEIITNAGNALYWMIKPNDYLVNFGDTDFQDVPRDTERYHDRSASLLYYYATNGSSGQKPTTNIACYTDSGFAAVKDVDSYLAQQAAFHSRTHKHADDLAIAWYDNDQDILIDSGKYGYQERAPEDSKEYKAGFWYADPKRIYAEKTRAHNTIEVDDSDQDRVNREPYGSAIKQCGQTNNGVYFIESEVEHTGSITHNRLLFLNPNNWLLVIDRLTPAEDADRNYKQWFHFAEDLAVNKNGEDIVVTGNNLDEKLYITELLPDSQTEIGPIVEQTEPYLQGWYSPSSGVFKASPTFAFEKEAGGSVSFATLLAFGNEDVSSAGSNSLSEEKGRFTWQESNILKALNFSYGVNGDLQVEFSEN